MPLPKPHVSYFLTVVDREGNLVTSGMVRAIPDNMPDYDDTMDRLALMAMFGARCLGPALPFNSPQEVWAFWENHALTNGFRLAAVEPATIFGIAGEAQQVAPQPAPPVEEPPPAVAPTHPEGGHA